LHSFHREGISQAVLPDARTGKLGKMRPAPQSRAKVAGEAANVSAFGARYPKINIGQCDARYFKLTDSNLLAFDFGGVAASRYFVRPLSVDFDG
jgi:hypothetical protein